MPAVSRRLSWSRVRRWWPEDRLGRAAVRPWTVCLTVLVLLLGYLVIDKADDWHGLVARALKQGRKPKLEEVGFGWLWWATVANLGIASVLWLTIPLWAQSNTVRGRVEECAGRGWGWIVMVVLLLATGMRVPRMELSLYNDEAHNYARLFAGSWEKEGLEAVPAYDQARWGETFWRNSGGNNAQPYSVLARLCLEGAMAIGGVELGEVSEWSVRLPSLLAGVISIALAGGLARRWFGQWAGCLTMLVLAVHPWHVRQSTEARGQSLLLLGVVICFFCLVVACRNGRWRAWLGYGLGLFVCASSFIGCVYFLLVMTVSLLVRQMAVWRAGGHGFEQVLRPLVASVLGAMLGIQLMVPILPELIQILANNPAFRGEMGGEWWRDELGFGYLGTRWGDEDPTNPDSMALVRWVMRSPWGWTFCLVAWMVAVLVGLVVMVRRGGVARLLAVATLVGVPLTWGVATLQGNYLNLWYLYFALPAAVVAIGAALGRVRRLLSVGWMALVIAPMVKVSVALWDRPKQDNRWPVEVVRGGASPGDREWQHAEESGGEAITAAFWCNADLYDPEMMVLREAVDLLALIKASRVTGRPLWVCFSHAPLARSHAGEMVSMLEDEGVFEKVGVRYGLEEYQFAMHLYRLR